VRIRSKMKTTRRRVPFAIRYGGRRTRVVRPPRVKANENRLDTESGRFYGTRTNTSCYMENRFTNGSYSVSAWRVQRRPVPVMSVTFRATSGPPRVVVYLLYATVFSKRFFAVPQRTRDTQSRARLGYVRGNTAGRPAGNTTGAAFVSRSNRPGFVIGGRLLAGDEYRSNRNQRVIGAPII